MGAPVANVGVANLPNQLHRLLSRKGTDFTLMVVGDSGLGKTTYVNTLFTTTVLQPKQRKRNGDTGEDSSVERVPSLPRTVNIEITKAVIEEKGFRCRLTIVDTPGFGDHVDNTNCWVPLVKYIDDQHEQHFRAESQPMRDKDKDTRVHACLYFIPPTGQGLRPLDIAVMKELGKRVNLIPVIAKADTVSPLVMHDFKERIREAIARHGITPYTCPIDSDDEETTKGNIDIMSSMPFSVIGSMQEVASTNDPAKRVLGRKYAWGTAEVENETHCDFKKLRSLLIRTHMVDLIETTTNLYYENYRTHRLHNRSGHVDNADVERARSAFLAQIKDEEERFRARLADKVRVEESRFQQWEERLVQERARLAKSLESEHVQLKQLIAEVEALEMCRKF